MTWLTKYALRSWEKRENNWRWENRTKIAATSDFLRVAKRKKKSQRGGQGYATVAQSTTSCSVVSACWMGEKKGGLCGMAEKVMAGFLRWGTERGRSGTAPRLRPQFLCPLVTSTLPPSPPLPFGVALFLSDDYPHFHLRCIYRQYHRPNIEDPLWYNRLSCFRPFLAL